nr:collagen alpha-3(IX) chain-like [Penaeus vannamei]
MSGAALLRAGLVPSILHRLHPGFTFPSIVSPIQLSQPAAPEASRRPRPPSPPPPLPRDGRGAPGGARARRGGAVPPPDAVPELAALARGGHGRPGDAALAGVVARLGLRALALVRPLVHLLQRRGRAQVEPAGGAGRRGRDAAHRHPALPPPPRPPPGHPGGGH